MLKDLVKVSNRLDSLGLHKEADFLDSLLRKEAGEDKSEELKTLESYVAGIAGMIDSANAYSKPHPLYEDSYGKELLASLARVAAKAGVSPEEAMEMIKERTSPSSISESDLNVEPAIDIETLKEVYKDFTKKMMPDLDSLEVNELYWTTDPATGSFYVVKAEGTWDDGAPLNIDSQIWPVKESYGRFTMTVEGDDGKIYYLYTEY
jgi:hypothetical protein